MDVMSVAMIRPIVMEYFTKQSSEDLYRAYRKLKYQVFVTELGWSSLKDESGEAIARPDPFDEVGRFLVAMTEEGLPIGTVRAVHLKRAFPHRDLFERHCCNPEFSCLMDSACTLNALAVLPEYRRKTFRISGRRWIGSAAHLLMLGMIRHMEQEGSKAAIVTTDGIVPTRLCHSLGFRVIDSPTITDLRSEPLVNMGMVFGSEAHICVQRKCGMKTPTRGLLKGDPGRLLCYFESCERQALGSHKLERLFRNQPVRRRASRR